MNRYNNLKTLSFVTLIEMNKYKYFPTPRRVELSLYYYYCDRITTDITCAGEHN